MRRLWLVATSLFTLVAAGCTGGPASFGDGREAAGQAAPPFATNVDEPVPPRPPFDLDVRHGSIVVLASDVGRFSFFIDGSPWPTIVTVEDEPMLPFLEPQRRYEVIARWTEDGIEHEHVAPVFTPPSPHRFGGADAPIHPGQKIRPAGSQCTLAFLARGPANDTLYGLTAGHCLDQAGIGGRVWYGGTWTGIPERRFGTVAAFVADSTLDWGLIQIEGGEWANVTPKVAHWSGPLGLAVRGDLAYGDTLCHVGHGGGYEITEYTRPRCGHFVQYATAPGDGYSALNVWMSAATYDGDSGSPVIDHATGRAVGIHLGTFINSNYAIAFAACAAVELAAQAGHPIAILQAGYEPVEPYVVHPPLPPIGDTDIDDTRCVRPRDA